MNVDKCDEERCETKPKYDSPELPVPQSVKRAKIIQLIAAANFFQAKAASEWTDKSERGFYSLAFDSMIDSIVNEAMGR